jgi:hypothetical protein
MKNGQATAAHMRMRVAVGLFLLIQVGCGSPGVGRIPGEDINGYLVIGEEEEGINIL